MTDVLEAGTCDLPFLKVFKFIFRSSRTIQSQTFGGQPFRSRYKSSMSKKYICKSTALVNCFCNPRESEI